MCRNSELSNLGRLRFNLEHHRTKTAANIDTPQESMTLYDAHTFSKFGGITDLLLDIWLTSKPNHPDD